ncbi:hypothetical protein Avbf_09924, partial [Armadillidium vulgare]
GRTYDITDITAINSDNSHSDISDKESQYQTHRLLRQKKFLRRTSDRSLTDLAESEIVPNLLKEAPKEHKQDFLGV